MADWTYRLCKTFANGFRVVCRTGISGMENIPGSGPCLLVSNHISHFDPPMIAMAVDRPIDYLASAEFFTHPVPRWLLSSLNAFPIERGSVDLGAVRTSISRLKQGRLVGVFPEGGIRHGKTSVLNGAPLPSSFVSLAQSGGAPIVPLVIVGADQLYQKRSWLRRPRLFLRCGKPIEYGAEAERQEIAEEVAARMRVLYEEIRRDHALRDDEAPRSAQERWAAG